MWWKKIVPMLPNLLTAIRNRDWYLVLKYLATILVIGALGSGLVVLSGCGQMQYSSSTTPAANTTVIERIQDPARPSSSQDRVVIPGS